MYELKKLEKYLRVNLLGTGPSSYKKIIYRATVSQSLRNTDIEVSYYSLHLRSTEIILIDLVMGRY
jgi:hypothetical protein